ncbi:unnamed protein product [Spirodela intermedia]|uniref:RRM domain-containing protein n=1 Tax=Spirodela intermedia TaxID=51605 RepID=A0A7I8IBL2_SPIIN|nr:unnamed protein product [Spirodela intermedia]CAA6655099.1 unnamed protein product [Spirodela intermedia]
MSDSRRSRYSRSPSHRSVSLSFSRSRSRSRSGASYGSSDVDNPGNNLYVTGLSSRVTKDDLESHFESEGKVTDVHLVVDPWTRESHANRCIKYLNRSVLESRVITVEKARRRRGRTPTPGRYLGLRSRRVLRTTEAGTVLPTGRGSYSPTMAGATALALALVLDPLRSPYHSRRYDRSSGGRRYRRSYSRDSRSSYSRSYSPYYSRRRHRRSVSRSASPSVSPGARSYSRSYSPRPAISKRSPSRSFSPRRCRATPGRVTLTAVAA